MKDLLKSEQQLYRQYLAKHPSELFWLALGFLKFVVCYLEFRIILLLRKAVPRHRPKEAPQDETILSLDKLPEIMFQPFAGTVPQDVDIKLATEKIKFNSDINWDYPYRDKEDSYALNRFGWLLSSLLRFPSDDYARTALKKMLSWISQKSDDRSSLAWESYSIAERLANWPFIILIIRKMIPISDEDLRVIARSMDDQLRYLMNNLEYNGRFTNNHLLNDARGLYISGVVLNNEHALKKAREVFLSWTKKVFYPDGMMKEGSSHYQLLLSQRYEQVYFISRHTEDKPFADFLQEWVYLMQEACDFFFVHSESNSWQIPLFGDISPDFSPSWFLPDAKSGWEELKRWLNWSLPQKNPKADRKGFENKGDFIRINEGPVTIFWHKAEKKVFDLNHGHHDLGGFVLFYKGIQVFADPGLFSYDEKYSTAKSAKAHNSLLLDSFGALCEDYKLNRLNAYHFINTRFNVLQNEEYFSLEICSEGFKRLPVPVKWSRKFTVYPDRMIITDNLKSALRNTVESRFQISPGLEIEEDYGSVSIYNTPIRLKVADSWDYKYNLIQGHQDNIDGGWVSSEYGSRKAASVVVFQRELSLDKIFEYKIGWQNVDA